MNCRACARCFLGLLALTVALLLPVSAAAQLVLAKSDTPAGLPVYTGSHVLIVGINKYPNLPKALQLQYAVNDATEVRDILVAHYGFPRENVKFLTDDQATLANIRAALSEFGDRLKVKADDRILVYFSGHGQTIKDGSGADRGFLVPSDAKVNLENPQLATFEATCLPMQEVWDKLDPSPAKHIAIIADACFSGLLTKARSIGPEYGLSAYLTMPARQAITAGGRGQKTWEADKYKHGVFTFNLLQELKRRAKQKQQIFPMVELFAAVLDPVVQMSKGRQVPQYSPFFTEGQMLFFASGAQAPPVEDPIKPPDDPRPSKPGKLIVKSKPEGASVFVDGQQVGTTPLTTEIEVDNKRKIRVTVELSGYESVEKEIEVKSKKESRLDLKLKKSSAPDPPRAQKARLTITSDPAGATVSIDGVEKGVTPYTYEQQVSRPTAVAVRLVLAGYEVAEQQATLDSSAEARVAVALTKTERPVDPPVTNSPIKLQRLATISANSAAQDIRFSPDGRQVAVVDASSTLSIYEVSSGRLLRSVRQPDDAYVRLTGDWKSLMFVSLLNDGTRSWASILVQDLLNDKSGRALSADMSGCSQLNYAWSDGRTAIVCGQSPDGKATIASIDLASGQALSFEASGRMTAGVVSSDGSVLATFREGARAGSNLAANLVLLRGSNRMDQQEIQILDSDMGAAVMMPPRGDLVAVNSGRRVSNTRAQSKGMRVFEARTGKLRFATPNRMALGFLSSGTRILGWSEAEGGTLEMFDVASGASLGKMTGPKMWLSSDGKLGASQGANNTITLSEVEPNK
jgi:hypothetical protein